MLRLWILFGCLFGMALPLQAAETIHITSNQVYAEAERIEADVLAIMKKKHQKSSSKTHKVAVNFKPRHVWQKTYEILVKINIFRAMENYPTIAVNTLEPTSVLHPKMIFDQTQRILTELNLIKVRMNITKKYPTPSARIIKGKMPKDVYALLAKISHDLDALTGAALSPSNVFAEVIRINSDIEVILEALNIRDESFPPIKSVKHDPSDAFHSAMELMDAITILQRFYNIETTDFSALKKNNIRPSDVFSLVGLISAELQPIKYALSLRHYRTPFAKHYEDKTPSDVEQMLGWCFNKFKQIRPGKQ
ncbi:MAG: hypothetical protein R8M38_10190 [Mariprofundaceae bacterium]